MGDRAGGAQRRLRQLVGCYLNTLVSCNLNRIEHCRNVLLLPSQSANYMARTSSRDPGKEEWLM